MGLCHLVKTLPLKMVDSEKGKSECWGVNESNLRNTFRREREIDPGLGNTATQLPWKLKGTLELGWSLRVILYCHENLGISDML